MRPLFEKHFQIFENCGCNIFLSKNSDNLSPLLAIGDAIISDKKARLTNKVDIGKLRNLSQKLVFEWSKECVENNYCIALIPLN